MTFDTISKSNRNITKQCYPKQKIKLLQAFEKKTHAINLIRWVRNTPPGAKGTRAKLTLTLEKLGQNTGHWKQITGERTFS